VNTERVKKSFLFALFYPKLFVCLFLFRHSSSLFFVHSGFFFGIKERKTRDVFIDTHARTELSLLTEELLQREREKKKDHHGEERGNTLCFVCDVQQKRKSRKKAFATSRDDEKSSFFFNLLFPFPGGAPFF